MITYKSNTASIFIDGLPTGTYVIIFKINVYYNVGTRLKKKENNL